MVVASNRYNPDHPGADCCPIKSVWSGTGDDSQQSEANQKKKRKEGGELGSSRPMTNSLVSVAATRLLQQPLQH